MYTYHTLLVVSIPTEAHNLVLNIQGLVYVLTAPADSIRFPKRLLFLFLLIWVRPLFCSCVILVVWMFVVECLIECKLLINKLIVNN